LVLGSFFLEERDLKNTALYSFLFILLNKNGYKPICEARSRPLFIPDY